MNNKNLMIIAELGINHNGSLKIAKKLVDVAKASGANYVKIQNYIPDLIVTRNTPKAKYQRNHGNNKTMYEMLKKYYFNFDKTTELIKYCKKKKINFLSSPFDEVSFQFLKKKKINLIKVASGEITNYPLLKLIAKYNKKLILSTGMANMREVKNSINFLCKNGQSRNKIYVLHCTSQYPTKLKNVNLKAMITLKNELKLKTGLSDHTQGFEAGICAVFLGAEIIEKHITLNRKMKGPDHSTSMEPSEFRSFVRSLNNSTIIGGSAVKKPTKEEKILSNLVRKRIVAKQHILKNELFSVNNITVKRCNTGIKAEKFFNILNKKAKKNYKPDEPI
jgi:N,N'-diacetyllegionaminate synthase